MPIFSDNLSVKSSGPSSPNLSDPTRLRVAVIGSGAAGIAAAWLLQRQHDVTLLERRDRLGGHVHTVDVASGPDEGTAVDTGFIVMNDRNYPIFTRFLNEMQVPRQDSDMSFSFSCRQTGFEYNGSNLNTLFAQRRNLLNPGFIRMLRDIMRFNKQALADVGQLGDISLGDYLADFGFRSDMVQRYVVPMGAAIWSTSMEEMMAFPASTFIRFFDNHGLLTIKDRPQWQTLVGGSRAYVEAFTDSFSGTIRTGVELAGLHRATDQVTLRHTSGEHETFDHVVIATHADQALELLDDPSPEETQHLGAWAYSRNHTVLHTDAGRMPRIKRSWASWNVIRQDGSAASRPVHLTYDMNRLQNLSTKQNYFVTLNDPSAWRDEDVIREMTYQHPLFTRAALASQPHLPSLNGVKRTWFCGSYFGYGFHEDAFRSGIQVGEALSGSWSAAVPSAEQLVSGP